jgi:hypothetical protein
MPTTSSHEPEGGAAISCPVCGKNVRLPAETCPSCGTNLRTGEKPEKESSVWERRGFKALVVTAAVAIPLASFLAFSGVLDNVDIIGRARMGLQSCADPPLKMWEAGGDAEDRQAARNGYSAWRTRKKIRPQFQDPNGPETEEQRNMTPQMRATMADRRNYFALAMMAERNSIDIMPEDNWYGIFVGEWDVAWITGRGTEAEKIVQGEWIFSWINRGEAIEDVMAVPYRWESSKGDPIIATAVRAYDTSAGAWRGFRVQDGRAFHFSASRNQDRNIYETYQDGTLLVTWIFFNITQEGFQVTLNQTTDGGMTYSMTAEIWAKRREILQPQ